MFCHVRVRLTGDIASAQAIGQCFGALVEVSEPLRRFAEDALFQIQLGRLGYDARRSQTLASFVPAAKTFLS